MKPPHTPPTRGAAWRRVIAAALLLLLMACITRQAAAEFIRSDASGSLVFCIDPPPGKGGWLIAKLNASGDFVLYGIPQTARGNLPAPQSRRIFEEFEKLCTASGLDLSRPPAPQPPRGIRKPDAFIQYASLQGRVLELRAPDAPLPPQLVGFLRILWQKLLHQATQSQHPPAAHDPASRPAPPDPANLR